MVTDQSIDTLAATVRAGLDRDEKAAQRNICGLTCMSHQADDWHRVRNQRGSHMTRQALESVRLGMLGEDWAGMPDGIDGNEHTIHYVLMNGTAVDPVKVLARVSRDRRLLDLLLAEKHHEDPDDDPHYTCPILIWPHIPCTCGRDTRVAAYLGLLAETYEETT